MSSFKQENKMPVPYIIVHLCKVIDMSMTSVTNLLCYSLTIENGDRTKTVVSMCNGLVILLLLKWLLESVGQRLQQLAVSCYPQSNICASVCGWSKVGKKVQSVCDNTAINCKTLAKIANLLQFLLCFQIWYCLHIQNFTLIVSFPCIAKPHRI